MPDIIIFSTVEEAIKILKNYHRIIEKSMTSKEEIIRKSVSSSVFRAFHNRSKKPSVIYREWASKNIDLIISELNVVSTKEEFDKILHNYINSFIENWNLELSNTSEKIIYGPASKMINLLFKTLNESNLIKNNKIQTFLHVPFDEFSLKPLISIINNLTDVKYSISIPKNPTMKYISNPQLYGIIQDAVFKLCKESTIDPIIYDYWCWNEKH